MSTSVLNAEDGSTNELVFVHFMGGPRNGQTVCIPKDDFVEQLPMTYQVIDAYVKKGAEHYEVGYVGSLSWPGETT